jgi:outer membrane protein W
MKRISLIILLVILAPAIRAQMYIHFSTGYTFSTQPFVHQNRVITDSIIDQFKIKFSYGKGLNIGLGVGYAFSDNFFTELNVSTALFSRSHSDNDWEYYFKREYLKLHLSGLNGDAMMKNTSIQVAPLIGYSVNAGRFRPYIKAGLNILYLKSLYSNSYTYRYLNDSFEWYLEYTDVERIYSGSLKLGFRGSAGFSYSLSDHVRLSAEFMTVNSMYHFKESRTLTFRVDGIEKVDELEENPEKFDDNEGTIDFSNIGFNFGFRYLFNGKTKH